MLDDLRSSANSEYSEDVLMDDKTYEEQLNKPRAPFLGMSAAQRFIIALFLFLMVAILGIFLLIVFQKVYPAL
jgi:hypothetical protein